MAFFGGVFFWAATNTPSSTRKSDELAAKYGVSNTTIAMAWLLRHPAKFQPVTGTMNPQRLRDCVKAAEIAAHARGVVFAVEAPAITCRKLQVYRKHAVSYGTLLFKVLY